jgi:hypothetical protein
MNPQATPPLGKENQHDISSTNQPAAEPTSNNQQLAEGTNTNTQHEGIVTSNFVSEENTTYKKKRKTHKKAELIVEIILVVALLATVYIKFFAPKSNKSIASSQINIQTGLLSTRGWEAFNDENDSVSFKYPDVNDPEHLTGPADQGSSPSDAPTTSVSPDAQSVSITYPDDTKSDLHDWATQNNEPYGGTLTGPNENMTLNISLSTSPSGSSETTKSASTNSVSIAQSTSGYTYKLINVSSGDEDLEQCQTGGSCSTNIRRSNTAYPYAAVSISPEAGTTDFHSHNFAVMKTVISSLSLFAKQSDPSYSAATNLTPCNEVNGMSPQYVGGPDTSVVVSKDATNRTLTISQDPYSTPPSQSHTITVPQSVPIIGVANECHTITFEAIQIGDGINLYGPTQNGALGIVEDTKE